MPFTLLDLTFVPTLFCERQGETLCFADGKTKALSGQKGQSLACNLGVVLSPMLPTEEGLELLVPPQAPITHPSPLTSSRLVFWQLLYPRRAPVQRSSTNACILGPARKQKRWQAASLTQHPATPGHPRQVAGPWQG